MVEIEILHSGVNGKLILKRLSRSVNVGEASPIIGPNAAGKLTRGGVGRSR